MVIRQFDGVGESHLHVVSHDSIDMVRFGERPYLMGCRRWYEFVYNVQVSVFSHRELSVVHEAFRLQVVETQSYEILRHPVGGVGVACQCDDQR